MLLGPVFTREAATAPRRARLYLLRGLYPAVLLLLMCTAWLVLAGTQMLRNVGDFARFGAILFQLLAVLQFALAFFFSALLTAGAVSQEKDRRTLVLLLMTRLTNHELVLGKFAAALLVVFALLAAAAPLFMLAALLGGVSFGQIARVFAVTAATALAAGAVGSTMALWRDKTFQALALSAVVLVAWLGAGEAVAAGVFDAWLPGAAAFGEAVSPWRALAASAAAGASWAPTVAGPLGYVVLALAVCVVLNVVSTLRVRAWNGSEVARRRGAAEDEAGDWEMTGQRSGASSGAPAGATSGETVHAAPGRQRRMWKNPILWRELRTWAYGRKILAVKLAYLAVAVAAAIALHTTMFADGGLSKETAAAPLAPLSLLSFVLINALAVTTITNERDGRALDLLLATDLTPVEVVFGKLAGVIYNTREMWLAPPVLCIYAWSHGAISTESTLYLVLGFLVLAFFAAVVGLHVGMTYVSSRSAILVSLAVVFFLFVGVAVCMQIMTAFRSSFHLQMQPFFALLLGGFLGLYVSLGIRNPSGALALAALSTPFLTFWAIASFLMDYTLGVFLAVAVSYLFFTAALLVPAIYEFDVATGRTSGDDD